MMLSLLIVILILAGCATGPVAEKRAEARRLVEAAAEAGKAKDSLAARKLLEQARTILRESGDKGEELKVLRVLGDELARAGQVREAIAVREEALSLARETKDPVQQYELTRLVARSRQDLGEIDAAIQLFKENLRLIESHGGFIETKFNWGYGPPAPLIDLGYSPTSKVTSKRHSNTPSAASHTSRPSFGEAGRG